MLLIYRAAIETLYSGFDGISSLLLYPSWKGMYLHIFYLLTFILVQNLH